METTTSASFKSLTMVLIFATPEGNTGLNLLSSSGGEVGAAFTLQAKVPVCGIFQLPSIYIQLYI